MTNRTTVRFSNRTLEMIKQVQEELGYTTMTSVIQQAVIMFHTKTFPSYTLGKKMSVDDKIDMKEKMAENKKKKEVENMTLICDSLGGEVVDKGGIPFCVYHNYSNAKRYEQEIPLDMLTPDLVDRQYFPSKKKVEQLQKDKKVDYKI